MAKLSFDQINAAMQKTLSNVNEILAKSGYPMQKAGPEDELEGQGDPSMGAGAPPEGDPSMGAGAPPEGDPSMGAEGDAGAAPEGDPSMGAEGAEGGEGDESQEMMAHLQSMGEDELHMMLEMVQHELAEREAQAQSAPEAGAAPAPAPAAGGAPDQLQMSMKKEFAGLAKSMNEIAKSVAVLAQNQAAVQAEVTTLKKSTQKPAVQKPAAQNARNVQVLEKSEEVKVEKLSKSGIENYLMNELRKTSQNRNPAVTRDLIADLTYVKTPDDIKQFAGKLRDMGIQLPS